MGNVQFGFGSHHVATLKVVDDSGYSQEEWAEMSEKERLDALWDWVSEQCEAWVEVDGE